jgi:hypothetical protein
MAHGACLRCTWIDKGHSSIDEAAVSGSSPSFDFRTQWAVRRTTGKDMGMTRRNKPRRVRAALLTAVEEVRDRLVPDGNGRNGGHSGKMECAHRG